MEKETKKKERLYTVKCVESGNKMWFHTNWVTTKYNGHEISVSSGAGAGNTQIIFFAKNEKTGKTIRHNIDISDLIEQWVKNNCKK